MGIYYTLVNVTRREKKEFAHFPSKKRELAGSPATAAMIAWYLLEHPKDHVSLVGDDIRDTGPHWPLPGVSESELREFPDRTDEVVKALVAEGILRDHGRAYEDPDDPRGCYIRDVRNVWLDDVDRR